MTSSKSCSVVTYPQVYVKPYVTGPSTKCYFNEFLFMRILTHDKIEYIDGSERSGVPRSPGFVSGIPPRDGC